MLKQGHIAHRSCARKIIYFVTDSDLIGSLPAADQFKANDGIIIVNNFIKAGEVHYLTDTPFQQKEWLSLQLLCKANCYCRKEAGFTPYANYNKDPTKPASGGCFKAINSNYKFEDAKKKCTQLGSGLLDSRQEQGNFSDSNPEYPYFWIGYTRTDGRWNWEDHSTDKYTRWNRAFGEPSKNPVSNCATVDSYDSIDQDFWYAVACNNITF